MMAWLLESSTGIITDTSILSPILEHDSHALTRKIAAGLAGYGMIETMASHDLPFADF